MIVGSPGGSTIISTVLNIIVNFLDDEMPLEAALRAPKLMHRGESIELEKELFQDRKLTTKLRKLGHDVLLKETYGNAQTIAFDEDRHVILGESDPRGEGQAAGF